MKKIIKISAEWCGPCKALAPIFHKVSEMEEFKNVEFKEYDVDDEDGEEYVSKFSVRNIPTILILDENNELINKSVGALPENMLIKFLQENLNK